MVPQAYKLTIELQQTKPLIWREILLSSHITLDRLRDVIQIVMGWEDCHLHQFMHKNRCFASNAGSIEILEGEDEQQIRLSELLATAGEYLEYEYDFGDSWLHTVKLEEGKEISKRSPFGDDLSCRAYGLSTRGCWWRVWF